MAELAFSEIKQLTGINLATSIPIYFKDYNFSNNAGYVLGEGIYLNPDFFYNDKEEQLHLIKHEMTLLFFSLYYANTTSFLFSEGVAEYIAHDKSDGWDTSSLTDNLGEWIDFSYFNYRFNRDVYENIVSDLYSLSHQFVFFWCRTYGEESLFELYPVITAGNIIEKLEEYSNNTFREINNRFLDYSGVSP
ncbi:MAG: hypothetical protein PF518_17975 [Spirochaetaceae bacterium]|nr:hypothetical protein [Spirochaetaceae bacterium]